MLRGIIICPDVDLNERLEAILTEIGIVSVTRTLDRYPSGLELLRFLRAHAPQVVFVSTESTPKAMEIARDVEKNTPGVQIVAISRFVDPQILLEVMRAGIREFASLPFDRQALVDALVRIKDAVQARPPAIEATNQVFSFLPSKAGVGTSTLALNAAVAMSRVPDSSVLLSDFDLNSGMVRFMLKLDSAYCVTDAAEHALEMDESLWPTMVTTIDKLDVSARRKAESGFTHRANADSSSDGVHAAQLQRRCASTCRATWSVIRSRSCTNPSASSWCARPRFLRCIWRARSIFI